MIFTRGDAEAVGVDAVECLNRRLLIVGEVNTGKTALTKRILDEMHRRRMDHRLAILDLAPQIPPRLAASKGLVGLGGLLSPPRPSAALYRRLPLKPPRLSAKIEAEALAAAEENKKVIDDLFQDLSREGRDILFINDLSLYLQAGRAERLGKWLEPYPSVVANAYYGQRLGQGVLSERERLETEAAMNFFDRVIRL